jgi:hypothetical protein
MMAFWLKAIAGAFVFLLYWPPFYDRIRKTRALMGLAIIGAVAVAAAVVFRLAVGW